MGATASVAARQELNRPDSSTAASDAVQHEVYEPL